MSGQSNQRSKPSPKSQHSKSGSEVEETVEPSRSYDVLPELWETDPVLVTDQKYIEYVQKKQDQATKRGEPVFDYAAYDPYPAQKGPHQQFGQRDEHGQMQYPLPTQKAQGDRFYDLTHLDERKLPKDKAGRRNVYGEHKGMPLSGAENWRAYYSSWDTIGEQFLEKFGKDPLPPQEIKFCEKYGFYFGQFLGRGSYGGVWLVDCTRLKGGLKVLACKVLDLKQYAKGRPKSLNEVIHRMFKEVDLVKPLDHKNVVKVEHVFHIHDPNTGFPFVRVLLFMELCEGDLNSFILAKGSKLSEVEAKPIFRDMCEGLEYLHDNQVIHFDIKPANTLYISLSAGERCWKVWKLTDFGLAKRFASAADARVATYGGTGRYRAPELSDTKLTNAKMADIFSLGSTLIEMLCGKNQVIQCRDDFWPPRGPPNHCPEVASKWDLSLQSAFLIRNMIRKEYGLRPTIQQILSDPFFTHKTQQTGPQLNIP